MVLLLVETLYYRNLFGHEVVELVHQLVNLPFVIFDPGLLGSVGKIVFVFSDFEDLVNEAKCLLTTGDMFAILILESRWKAPYKVPSLWGSFLLYSNFPLSSFMYAICF